VLRREVPDEESNIKDEVIVLNKQRTNKKHHVLMVKWPYLAIVGGCGVHALQKVILESWLRCGAPKTSLQLVYVLGST
jgi:hypothetical protein